MNPLFSACLARFQQIQEVAHVYYLLFSVTINLCCPSLSRSLPFSEDCLFCVSTVSLRRAQSKAFCGVKGTDLEIRNGIPQLCGYGTRTRCQVSCGWHEFPYVTLALLSYHQKIFFLGHGKNSFGSHLPLMKRCYNYANCTPKGG